MAQKVRVLLVCDLHDDETEGGESVAFGLDGSSYEIDLCSQHAAELRDDLASYVGAARRASGGSKGSRKGSGSAKSHDEGASKVSEVRGWARANGYEVSERGRVSAQVLEAYEAASK